MAHPALHSPARLLARALLALEARWAGHLLDSWEADRTSLRGVPAFA